MKMDKNEKGDKKMRVKVDWLYIFFIVVVGLLTLSALVYFFLKLIEFMKAAGGL